MRPSPAGEPAPKPALVHSLWADSFALQGALPGSCEAVAAGAGFSHANSHCLNFTRSKLLHLQYTAVLRLNFWSYSN